MIAFRSIRIRIGWVALSVLLACGQLTSAAPAVESDPDFRNPQLLGPVNLLVPWDIRHICHNWTTGYMRLRIGADGRVKDWIPLDLPHYKLIPAIDRALKQARFSPALIDGEPVMVDMSAEIPLFEIGSYQVISETLAEHIESMQARMNPRQFQVVVSSPSELDEPLTLVSESDGYQVVDEEGRVLSGTAHVSFYVDTKGMPRMIQLEDATDPDLLDAAFMTVQEFRFAPPTRHRQPTVVRARIPVMFGE